MLRAMKTAATGMLAQEKRMAVISNNIANVNTVGFKKIRAEFKDLHYDRTSTGARAGGDSNQISTVEIGHGVRSSTTSRSFEMGSLQVTGNELDLAVEGDGFFQLWDPGTGQLSYTRDGTFRRNSEGLVVNADGFELFPQTTIPKDTKALSIDRNGAVSALLATGDTVQAGELQLVSFVNPGALESLAGNRLAETEGSGAPVTSTDFQGRQSHILQGYLEGSNVKVVDEMIQLITTQRAYEINSKVIQAADELMQRTTELR